MTSEIKSSKADHLFRSVPRPPRGPKLRDRLRTLRVSDWTMIVFFSSRLFTYLLSVAGNGPGIFLSIALMGGLLIAALISERKTTAPRALFEFFCVLAGFLLVALVTMLFNPQAKEWMLSFNYGLITQVFDPRKGMFALLVVLLVRDRDRLLRNLHISAKLIAVYLYIHLFLYKATGSWARYYIMEDARSSRLSYNLSFGYEMIFVSIVFFVIYLRDRRHSTRTWAVVTALTAFFFGSRGITIPLTVFAVICLAKWLEQKWHVWTAEARRRYLRIGLVALGLFLLIVGTVMVLQNRGVIHIRTGNRNIDMLLSGRFVDDNGRVALWRLVAEGIKEKFPLGYGLYGDRPFVGQRFHWGYSHNLFLELIISFGLIGVLLSGIVICTFFKMLWSSRYARYVPISLIFLSMNAKLLVSDSLWFYDFFWAALGLVIIVRDETAQARRARLAGAVNFARRKKRRALAVGGLVAVLVINVVLGAFVLDQSVKNQKYRAVRFERPTVAVIIQNADDKKVRDFVHFADMRGVPVTVFAPVSQCERLQTAFDEEEVEFQLKMPRVSMTSRSDDFVQRYMRDQLEAWPEDEKTALIGSTLRSRIYPRTQQALGQETDALIFSAVGDERPYYTKILPGDMDHLIALNGALNERNAERRMGYVKRHIDAAARRDGFMFLSFTGLSDDPYSHDVTYTQQYYFNGLILYLESLGFEFITVSEMVDRAILRPDQRTLKNLIVNSDFYNSLRGH